jgi:hypothetical protein
MHNLLKYCSYIGLVINIAAIIFTVLPYVGFETFKTVSTVIFLITFGIDLALITLNLSLVNRKDSTGQKLKSLSRLSLVFLFLAAVMLFMVSLIYSFIEVGSFVRIFGYIGLFVAYYGIFVLGLVTVFMDIQNRNRTETWI